MIQLILDWWREHVSVDSSRRSNMNMKESNEIQKKTGQKLPPNAASIIDITNPIDKIEL